MRLEDLIARRTFRAWVRVERLTAARLAAVLRVPLWRAEQLACGRLLVSPSELLRLGSLREAYFGMLERELRG